MAYRDLEYTTTQYVRTYTGVAGGLCKVDPALPQPYSVSMNGLKKARGRSEITQSDGVTATPYRAWKIDASGGKVDLTNAYRYRCASRPFPYVWSTEGWVGRWSVPSFYLHFGLLRYGTTVENTWFKPSVGNQRNLVRNAMIDAMKTAKVDFGETIGGIAQTANMLGGTLLNAVRALNALRRGKPKDAMKYARAMVGARPIRGPKDKGLSRYRRTFREASKALASGYLGGIFGWAPLINDLKNGRQAILDAFGKPGPHGSITRSGVVDVDPQTYIAFGDPKEAKGSIQIGSQQGVHYRVSNVVLAGLNQIGLANPLLTAWQILPLSFVVDWFFSISSFLGGLSTWLGLTFIGGYETNFVRGNYSVTDYSIVSSSWSGTFPVTNTRYFGMDRIPFSAPPLPTIAAKLPLNSNQWMTAAALLRAFT